MIGLALYGVEAWLVVRGFDYTFLTDYLYALLFIFPGVAIILSLIGIIGTLGMWYRVHLGVRQVPSLDIDTLCRDGTSEISHKTPSNSAIMPS